MIKIKKTSMWFNILSTIILSLIFAFGIVFFLEPSNLISLGLTGVAQLVSRQLDVGFGYVYLILNIPGIILSYLKLGKRFTLYSLISVMVVTLTTEIIPALNLNVSFTDDRIVNCMFAASIMGFALGGLLKIGSSSGGFDFYCLYLFKKYAIPFSYINLPINVMIVLISAAIYGIETALYSIIFIVVRELILNVFYTNNKKLTVWIIGTDLDSVDEYIHNKLGRGTSIFTSVEGGYTHKDKEVIMVVLNVVQFAMLKEDIYDINPNVFVFANKTYDVLGNYRVNK